MTDTARPPARLADALSAVTERIDVSVDASWDGLTGVQILILRRLAGVERMDRASLALDTRTARAATVPSLASLLQKGFVMESDDEAGSYLRLTDGGHALLTGVRAARAEWLERAARDAVPPVRGEDLVRVAALLEHLGGTGPR
ncbi:helix-turn-helix domain-containing protein [Clavibacter capsici]|uniref:MarR family transcriptional regulator n=1 Tax=Clavibacter capsici TaxID=1874630 RepID=A0A0M4H0F0_9MICO|nr:MarR family transcriptional regulator [Clavibacter capsici]ALD12874.1 MarR family transcriptional regulator [Clavibacter capsici]QIS39256.1 MarR family transcriptional regulator [Clavibacter capsici]QIS42098.1 MarR family transcriptional regulator [Clavibacter capsici]QIS45045.1 MarR family transcriptional regulator [Clavibacter capsici]